MLKVSRVEHVVDGVGNLVPAALKPRSQWEEYLQKRQDIDESIPTKTDGRGTPFP